MTEKISEYIITYAVKEALLKEHWEIIAYNPPGSQGTFTIPNPSKDPAYRGQTGSESPDVIAKKGNVVMVVECKPAYNKIDSEKLNNLRNNSDKMSILVKLINKVCEANGLKFFDNYDFLFNLAYSGAKHKDEGIGFIEVVVKSDTINISKMEAKLDYNFLFSVIFH